MTHEELLDKIANFSGELSKHIRVLYSVVNLHSPEGKPDQQCRNCKRFYPCHTIQAIIKELG